MASIGVTYTASGSLAVSNTISAALSLGASYTGSGTGKPAAMIGAARKIFTPRDMDLINLPEVMRRWVKDVSRLLNDGIEGQEVITPVKQAAADIETKTAEIDNAVLLAQAAAEQAQESADTVSNEAAVINEKIDELDARLTAIE